MSRTAVTVMIALVSTLSVVAAHAATPTVVPAASVSPSASPVASTTVEVAPPLAPTNLKIDLASRQITWQDNSSDETGFQIVYSVEGVTTVSATYTVAANVTSFEIPATAPAFSCGHTLKVLLTAVRGTIMSAPAQNGLSSICPPPSSGANSPVSNLPRTGALADRGDRRATVELIAILLLMSGASLVWFGRSRPRL